jgi:hypothetical protein
VTPQVGRALSDMSDHGKIGIPIRVTENEGAGRDFKPWIVHQPARCEPAAHVVIMVSHRFTARNRRFIAHTCRFTARTRRFTACTHWLSFWSLQGVQQFQSVEPSIKSLSKL